MTRRIEDHRRVCNPAYEATGLIEALLVAVIRMVVISARSMYSIEVTSVAMYVPILVAMINVVVLAAPSSTASSPAP